MSKLVSIIIPSFNRADLLKRAINSILNQTYNNWEIIVIDNNSKDHTDKILNDFKNINLRTIKINNNGIIACSRNEGIRKSSGEFIAFLDSDDWWVNNKLETSVNYLNDESTDLIYHNCFIKNYKNQKKSNCRQLKSNQYEDLLYNGNTIITSSVMIKKDKLVGLSFSESIDKVGWEDYDLWIKLSAGGLKFKFINNILGYYWVSDGNFDNPNRVLLNIENIQKLVINNLKNTMNKGKIWWPNYTRGIAYFHLKNKNLSIKYFLKVVISRSPLKNKIKSLFYVLIKIPLMSMFH